MGIRSQDIQITDNSPYHKAVFNPNTAVFGSMVKSSQRTILEIGCGTNPKVSWRLNKGDLWVGCDPQIRNDKNDILVHGRQKVDSHAKLVVFASQLSDIPLFFPDILSAVAPNQRDIVQGNFFNDDMTKFLTRRVNQNFGIVLDTRTHEALLLQNQALSVISQWMKANKFLCIERSHTFDNFKPVSEDLGIKNKYLFFVRR